MLLDEPAMTRVVNAQAALLSGDRRRAQKYFELLSADRDTEVSGIKGLLDLSLEDGDTDRALRLARRAFVLQPKENGTLDSLLGLQAQIGDWRGARDTLRAKTKAGHLPKDVSARREAVLLLADARVAHDEGEDERARKAVMEAVKKAPGLAPAAALATELLAKAGQSRKASRVAIDAWRKSPHPSIAAAFAAIEPDESPDERKTRFANLTAAAPDHPETRMLSAELELAANRFDAAHKALGDLADSEPSARVCAIMAAVEKGNNGSEAMVRGWLAKALTASRGPQWICDNCGFIASDFAPLCPNCDAFDTLTWRESDNESDEQASGAAMAPLLVGGDAADGGNGAAEPDMEAQASDAGAPMTAEAEPEAGSGEATVDAVEGAGKAAQAEASEKLEQTAAARAGGVCELSDADARLAACQIERPRLMSAPHPGAARPACIAAVAQLVEHVIRN